MYLRIQKRTSELLSKGNVTDKPSQYVDMILFILIILNVFAVCLESVKDIGETYKEKKNNRTLKVLKKQITVALKNVKKINVDMREVRNA